MNQVNLVGMAERNIFGAKRARVAQLALIEEALEAHEIDRGRRSGFFLCRSTHRRTVFANVARGQVPGRLATAKRGPIQRIGMNAASRLNESPSTGQMAAIFRLARPHQWIKNTLVLAALVFGKRLFVFHDVVLAAVAFVAFCALSSAGYILNDVADREADRLNPEKCDRPLARGDLSVAAASRAALVLGLSFNFGAAVTAFRCIGAWFALARCTGA